METLEVVTSWLAVTAYAVVCVLLIARLSFGWEKGERAALLAGVIGVLLHTAGLVARSVAAGHLPMMGNYETASAAAWFVSLPAAAVAMRSRKLRSVALAAFPVAMFMLGWAMLDREPTSSYSPAYRSWWLYVHVGFANLAFGGYAVAAGAAGCLLVRQRQEEKGASSRLPPTDVLDDFVFRVVVFGFLTCALMIVAGAFWADNLWGRFWAWDPVETWSLVSWLYYGLAVHLRLVHRWSPKRLAWMVVVSPTFLVATYWFSGMVMPSAHRGVVLPG